MYQRLNRFIVSRVGSARFVGPLLGAAAALLLPGCTGEQPESDESAVKTANLRNAGFNFYPGEEAYVIKSIEDRSVVDPTACDVNDPSDPWMPNLVGAGRMYSMQYRKSDGAIGKPDQIEVGVGTLCFQFLNSNFTPFDTIKARGTLALNGVKTRFEGRCMFTNHDMPVSGIHQLSCALPLVGPLPEGYKGGLLTTNSVVNAGHTPGYSAGSLLSLHMYQK